MEGWKKRDEEKDEIVEKARAEKAEIELKMNQQQQVGSTSPLLVPAGIDMHNGSGRSNCNVTYTLRLQ